MKRVFISYPHEDPEAGHCARFLHDHLPALGSDLIQVMDGFDLGDDWQLGITEQINKCSVFICFVQRKNPNVMFELGYALGKNKKIIVVGDFTDLPADIRNMTYVQREAHPYDVLMHVEKYLSGVESRESKYRLDLTQPHQTLVAVLDRPELLDNLDVREFEELVMQWFVMKGYKVERPRAPYDSGYDFLVRPFRGDRAAVEVKKYKTTSQVPLTVIRQLVGAMALESIPNGVIVSSAAFTRSADFFVHNIRPKILLWTLEDLVQMSEVPQNAIERELPGAHER